MRETLRLSSAPALAKLGIKEYKLLDGVETSTKAVEKSMTTTTGAQGIEKEASSSRPKQPRKRKAEEDDLNVELDWTVAVPQKRKKSEQLLNKATKVWLTSARMLTQSKKWTPLLSLVLLAQHII